MILFYVSIFFIILIGILVIIYYKQTNKRHKNRRDEAIKLLEAYGEIPLCLKNTYLIINQRRYEHIMTFFNFQLVNKVFGFLSVILSLITFISCILKCLDCVYCFKKYDDIAVLIVSFLSILCVIIALYASPNRRVNDYINAWRIDERTINEMTAEMDTYSTLPLNECVEKAEKYIERISSAEESIKSDED